MSFSDEMNRETAKIMSELENTVKSASLELYSALIQASPVDTGELKASWQMPVKAGELTYTVADIAPHAIIIDGGRREEGGKMVGSERLPMGYTPIVKAVEARVNKGVL